MPFGEAALAFRDAVLAVETCEELFTPAAPHIELALAGVEIISNGSGSHHQASGPWTPALSARSPHLRIFMSISHLADCGSRLRNTGQVA